MKVDDEWLNRGIRLAHLSDFWRIVEAVRVRRCISELI
jgi:hypothetical protein